MKIVTRETLGFDEKPIERIGVEMLSQKGGTSWLDVKLAILYHLHSIRFEGKQILDIGIGRGEGGWFLRKMYPKAVVDGVEVCENELYELNANIYRKIYLTDISKSSSKIPFEQYDLIVWLDCIEHLELEDAEKVCADLVQRGKLIIISTPNFILPQKPSRINENDEHKCFLDFRSMATMSPYMYHFTMYGAGTYFIRKSKAKPSFDNSDVSKRDLRRFLNDSGVMQSGFYTLGDQGLEFQNASIFPDTKLVLADYISKFA